MTIQQLLALAMKELHGVEKTGRHQQGYNYAGHEAVNEAVRPVFVKLGIVQTVSARGLRVHRGGHLSMTVRVRWSCADDSASFIEGDVPIFQHCQSKAGNPTVQMSGQLLSYGVKNFTFKTLMLTDSNEPDSDTLPHDSPKRESQPPVVRIAPEVKIKADAAVEAFAMIQTAEQLASHLAHWRKEWPSISMISGIGDRFDKAITETKKRLGRPGGNQ